MKPKLCLAILGPTASGKSQLALSLARTIGGEILCLDSTTVYRGFDIGTGKPTEQDRQSVPHHLLDLLDPETPFSAHDFVRAAADAMDQVCDRGKTPLVVGGTYFYLRALQQGMYPGVEVPDEVRERVEGRYEEDDPRMHADLKAQDPGAAEKIHPRDRYRLIRALSILEATGKKPSELKPENPDPNQRLIWIKYAVLLPRHAVHHRIETRTDHMLEAGWVEEVRALREKHPKARALGAIGYASVCEFLDGRINAVQMRNQIIERTRQLAKRQMTWLRSDPDIRFVDLEDHKRMVQEWSNLQETLGGTP